MYLAWQPEKACFTYRQTQSRDVVAFSWKDAAVDEVVRAVVTPLQIFVFCSLVFNLHKYRKPLMRNYANVGKLTTD